MEGRQCLDIVNIVWNLKYYKRPVPERHAELSDPKVHGAVNTVTNNSTHDNA